MPCDICKNKLKGREHETWSGNNILCVRLRDKDCFLSTKHKSADIKETGKLK
jgi:hypothetical protein